MCKMFLMCIDIDNTCKQLIQDYSLKYLAGICNILLYPSEGKCLKQLFCSERKDGSIKNFKRGKDTLVLLPFIVFQALC